jgi:GNAT superfamily N-acetyltransferase
MIQVPSSQWHSIETIVNEEIVFVAVSMIVQRRLYGEIWVDRAESPSVLIGLFPDDLFVWGDLTLPGVRPLLARARGCGANCPGLEQLLKEVWPEGYERLPCVGFRHVRHATPAALPAGFRLETIQPDNLSRLRAFLPEYAETVGDFLDHADFLRYGYGFMALEAASGACVSACVACSVSRERADHGVDTAPGYEGRGLGTAVAQATVQEGLRRGLRPEWMAEAANPASLRVAQKVGFTLKREVLLFERSE